MPPLNDTPRDAHAPIDRDDKHQLLLHERRLVMEARHRDALRSRWVLVSLALILAPAGAWTGVLAVSWRTASLIAAGAAAANVAALIQVRRDRFAPWQFWSMVIVDLLLLAGFTALLGTSGYLLVPAFLFAASGLALGLAPAAVIQLVLIAGLYPFARWFGLVWAGETVPGTLIALETVFLIGMSGLMVSLLASHARRLRATRTALAHIEDGDFTWRLDESHLDDIGFFSVSMNRALERIGQMILDIQDRARSLAALSDQMAATAQEMQASAEQMGRTTEELAAEADHQLAVVAEGRKALEEVTDRGRELRRAAAGSASDAQRLAHEAGRHADAVQAAGALLVDIGGEFRRSSTSMAALGSAGDRIGGFVKTIGDIAQQTNLLALNAAIEAARAGEEGSGFAVVAEEVRKLALQSGGSARDVAGLVDEIRGAIDGVQSQLSDWNTRLAGVGEVAEDGRKALMTIVQGLESTVSFIEQIAREIESQADALNDLHGGMARVQQIARGALDRAQQNAASTEQQVASMDELTTTSEQLAALAVQLDALASRFKVAGEIRADEMRPGPTAATAAAVPPARGTTRPARRSAGEAELAASPPETRPGALAGRARG
jgi:methyl-accepting chemotaxis protein